MTDVEAPSAVTGSEPDLLAQARYDLSAFRRLYEDCRLPIYRYLRSRGYSDADAADLTAATFERAFRGLARYRPQRTPLSWLLRIARNAAIDAGRRRHPLVPWTGVKTEQMPVDDHSPEAAYLARERSSELVQLVQTLPDAQRDAIALRYAGGLTAREIGAVIGKSEAATQKLLTRALAALKEASDDRF